MAETKVKRTRRRLYESAPGEDRVLLQETPVIENRSREKEALKIIGRYVKWSMGTSFIPIPLLDTAFITVIQIRMLKKLCLLYDMEFSKQRVKAVTASFIGGLHTGLIAGSLSKTLPLFGLAGAVTSMAVISGAITYAIGKVFVQHFETGGTLLDFDPRTFKETFLKNYKEGQKLRAEKKEIFYGED